MTPERWQQINELFHSALERERGQRAAFLAEACAGDESLRAEVESLVASHEQAESFIERDASDVAAELLAGGQNRLETGQHLGHYTITNLLGAGGMGEVYLAKDKKLDRQVAIKILHEKFSRDESNLSRFIQEAKAASALNHPNILVIHEIGETEEAHYIVSEFVKGETLRETFKEKSLRLPEVLDVSIQIAGALCTAHEAHLVHRDIKPENIMLRPDGYVKILDFGLAKLVEQKNGLFIGLEQSTAHQTNTAKGMIMGTVNYMSPEQAKGERIDERTDIFSFGVVVYEMLAGRTPFAGDSVSETFANLINAEPQPLSRFAANVPDEMGRIVAKTLRKNKDERYQTMKDVLTDLKGVQERLTLGEKSEKSHSPEQGSATGILPATTGGGVNIQTAETQNSFSQTIKLHKPLAAFALAALLIGVIGLGYYFLSANKSAAGAGGKKSIAVLPLKPINTANRDEIYEVGIADSLIHRLSSMKGFVVRPLSATRKYADINQDPIAAGREQQADYVLASNYQMAGGKIRVTSQLFNVASGQIEETKIIEKDAGDVFAAQDAIAGEVGNILSARFGSTSSGATAKRGTTNEEAYRLYLQGIYRLGKNRGRTNAGQAVENLEQAVRLDPNYAQAWAGKAHAHILMVHGTPSGDIYDYQKSIEAINKALALDENLADAHSALCENKMYYEHDFDAAERSCKRAVELDPNNSRAHEVYSRYLVLRGRIDEGIAEIKTAIDIVPTSLFNQRWYGYCLQYARRHAEAVPQLKRVIAMDENFATTYFFLSQALEMQGNYDEAFEWRMKSLALGKADEETVQSYQAAYQTSGWQGVLREDVKRFDPGKQYYFHGAADHAMLGDKDKAFEYLEKSYQRRELWITYLQVHWRFDSLRDDPRFDELVRRVGLK
ncbi:MAG: tetratricopeptide repeat-containing serine/threonine-protein kinase [Acidobacteriota bacterium]|nr:tetratricopeptide repeat-containing serine/threonine-protein kinase [Acidobacteriota bacterium]